MEIKQFMQGIVDNILSSQPERLHRLGRESFYVKENTMDTIIIRGTEKGYYFEQRPIYFRNPSCDEETLRHVDCSDCRVIVKPFIIKLVLGVDENYKGNCMEEPFTVIESNYSDFLPGMTIEQREICKEMDVRYIKQQEITT